MSIITAHSEPNAVLLPTPGGPANDSLMQALSARSSIRSFLPDALPLANLSALLQAAFGINRPDMGGRTAPSAHNWQEIGVYAVLAQGAYRYEAKTHRLLLVSPEDLRAQTGMQDFVATAPLNLVYVADFDRMSEASIEDRPFLAGVAAGCIAQNVYLYCAASGLGTVLRAMIDRQSLAPALGLTISQRILLAQTVGLPAAT